MNTPGRLINNLGLSRFKKFCPDSRDFLSTDPVSQLVPVSPNVYRDTPEVVFHFETMQKEDQTSGCPHFRPSLRQPGLDVLIVGDVKHHLSFPTVTPWVAKTMKAKSSIMAMIST